MELPQGRQSLTVPVLSGCTRARSESQERSVHGQHHHQVSQRHRGHRTVITFLLKAPHHHIAFSKRCWHTQHCCYHYYYHHYYDGPYHQNRETSLSYLNTPGCSHSSEQCTLKKTRTALKLIWAFRLSQCSKAISSSWKKTVSNVQASSPVLIQF